MNKHTICSVKTAYPYPSVQLLVQLLLLLLLTLQTIHNSNATTATPTKKTFLVVSKLAPEQSEFYEEVKKGCVDEAEARNVTCEFKGPTEADPELQRGIIDTYSSLEKLAGIAISALEYDVIASILQDIHIEYPDLPILVFDSDSKFSDMDIVDASIHIQNKNAGKSFGQMLLHLHEEMPGRKSRKNNYAIISSGLSDTYSKRVNAINNILKETSDWKPYETASDCKDDPQKALDQLSNYLKEEEIGAVISVGGWATWDMEGYEKVIQENQREDVITIMADGTPRQFSSMYKGHISAIVAQDCRGMGKSIIDHLDNMSTTTEGDGSSTSDSSTTLDTFPITELKYKEEMEYIGTELVLMGFIAYGVIVLSSIGFSIWACYHGENKVVKSSQPIFLHMICLGTLTLGSTIIPMGIETESGHSEKACDMACNSVFWLGSIGFIIVFSALFSKLWRINKIFSHAQAFRRIQVSVTDVMIPFVALMAAVTLVLTFWSIENPPAYRMNSCFRQEGHLPYMITIAVLIIISMGGAMYQAYQCREIETDYSESKYIAWIFVSLAQFIFLGVPIMVLTFDRPKIMYIIFVVFLFTFCMLTLLLIFVPKVIAMNDTSQMRRTMLYGYRSRSVIFDAKSKRLLVSAASSNNIPLSNVPDDIVEYQDLDEEDLYGDHNDDHENRIVDIPAPILRNPSRRALGDHRRSVTFPGMADLGDDECDLTFKTAQEWEVEFVGKDMIIDPNRRSSLSSRASMSFRRSETSSFRGSRAASSLSTSTSFRGSQPRAMQISLTDDLRQNFERFGSTLNISPVAENGCTSPTSDESIGNLEQARNVDGDRRALLAQNSDEFKSCREFEDKSE